MKRYLIHHGHEGTWDLVIEGDAQSIEVTQAEVRKRLPVNEFERSKDGVMFQRQLKSALERASNSAAKDT
jgi:hypothetical protein